MIARDFFRELWTQIWLLSLNTNPTKISGSVSDNPALDPVRPPLLGFSLS